MVDNVRPPGAVPAAVVRDGLGAQLGAAIDKGRGVPVRPPDAALSPIVPEAHIEPPKPSAELVGKVLDRSGYKTKPVDTENRPEAQSFEPILTEEGLLDTHLAENYRDRAKVNAANVLGEESGKYRGTVDVQTEHLAGVSNEIANQQKSLAAEEVDYRPDPNRPKVIREAVAGTPGRPAETRKGNKLKREPDIVVVKPAVAAVEPVAAQTEPDPTTAKAVEAAKQRLDDSKSGLEANQQVLEEVITRHTIKPEERPLFDQILKIDELMAERAKLSGEGALTPEENTRLESEMLAEAGKIQLSNSAKLRVKLDSVTGIESFVNATMGSDRCAEYGLASRVVEFGQAVVEDSQRKYDTALATAKEWVPGGPKDQEVAAMQEAQVRLQNEMVQLQLVAEYVATNYQLGTEASSIPGFQKRINEAKDEQKALAEFEEWKKRSQAHERVAKGAMEQGAVRRQEQATKDIETNLDALRTIVDPRKRLSGAAEKMKRVQLSLVNQRLTEQGLTVTPDILESNSGVVAKAIDTALARMESTDALTTPEGTQRFIQEVCAVLTGKELNVQAATPLEVTVTPTPEPTTPESVSGAAPGQSAGPTPAEAPTTNPEDEAFEKALTGSEAVVETRPTTPVSGEVAKTPVSPEDKKRLLAEARGILANIDPTRYGIPLGNFFGASDEDRALALQQIGDPNHPFAQLDAVIRKSGYTYAELLKQMQGNKEGFDFGQVIILLPTLLAGLQQLAEEGGAAAAPSEQHQQ